jgi:hypothetical protein
MPPMQPMDFGQEGADNAGQPVDLSTLINGDLSVQFSEQPMGTGSFEMGSDGSMKAVAPEDDLLPATSSPPFAQNLAEEIDEADLNRIAVELCQRIDEDVESRKPWVMRYRKGMTMMGLIEDEVDDGPFPGASTAVMPIISEAVVQFWAKAIGEQVPSEGPVKGSVSGKANKALNERAERVQQFMNHDIMRTDKGWYDDHSKLLWSLPAEGSCFKKVYRDTNLGRNVSEFVAAEDFICNYGFKNLESAPRFTHRIWRTQNEVKKAQVAGIYREVDLSAPAGEELSEGAEVRLEASDFEQSDDGAQIDSRYELHECYCEIDLPAPFADPDGIGRPYIITIEPKSQKILSIYRGWKEQDTLLRRRVTFIKYDFIPGPGFYGLGLPHLIGGLQQAATGALRLIIDGSATASLQGGFMSKDASIKDGNLSIEPGVWQQIDASSDDLAKAFYSPPMKEPSPALFNVLGTLIQRSEKFAATTEAQTGAENVKNAPVGSMSMMMEAGGRVFSAIHRGLHMSLGWELLNRYELIQEYMPVEGYPYDVEGNHQGLIEEDFAPGVSVIPVSDPNIFSTEQRVAQGQAVYQLAKENPDVIKVPVAVERLLRGLKVPDIEELLVTNEPPPPMDPVSEIQALLRGEPVQAYPDQEHLAYLQHYAAFMQNPQFGGNPELQAQIAPQALALIGQRLAYAWAMHNRALGVPAPLLPPPMGMPEGQAQGPTGNPQLPQPDQGFSDPSMAPMGPQNGPQGPAPAQPTNAPPEVIAQLAAQIAPQLAQVPGMPALGAGGTGPDPSQQAKAEAITQESQLKIAQGQQKMDLDAQMAAQKIQFEREKADLKMQIETFKAEQKMLLEQEKSDRERQMAEMQAAMSQQKMAAQAANDQRQAVMDAQAAQQQHEAHQQNLTMDAITQTAGLEQQAEAQAQDQALAARESTAKTQAMQTQAAAKAKAASKPTKPKKGTA